MKKLFPFFLTIAMLFSWLLGGNASAERLIVQYCPENGCLAVEYLGAKYPSWGPHDVECIQFDRICGVDPAQYGVFCPQIFLQVQGSPIRVEDAFQLPLGKEIYFRARAYDVRCGVEFQIFADVWVGDQIQRKWWAIGPGEPIPANVVFKNVEIVEDGRGGWVFRTTCCCP